MGVFFCFYQRKKVGTLIGINLNFSWTVLYVGVC